ncbi:hypothetical protein FRC00_005677 [Tulasnella sp. 408]|nr:hypothetical protein FRC00_005677 [Tulasnella sp. 408]
MAGMRFSCSTRRLRRYQVNTASTKQPSKMNGLCIPSRSPFLGLPQEIILMILLDVVEEEGEISWQERTRLQLICRALRDFVNFTPSFWSQISVSEPREIWQQHLDKSGQLELTVTCDCPPREELHASFLSTILPHAHRICSLTCSIDGNSSEAVVEVTTHAASTLRDLSLFYDERLARRIDGIPFDMLELETLELSGIFTVREPMWWEGTVLRVVKLENVNWVYEISTFLDFLEANDQLESFHYSLLENILDQEDLAPQDLPSYDTIVLPNLTHFFVYSIPAFHLLTILQHVSFPSDAQISATVGDSFPTQEPAADFIVPVMNRLAALRPPSSGITLRFDTDEAFLFAENKGWELGFYNDALNFHPRGEAYRTFLQQIPSEIRALISSANVAHMRPGADDPALLVKALSQDADSLSMFECLLDETWLSALWMDRSRGWDGFRLPKLDWIFFNVCETSTAADISNLTNLLQARSAAVQDKMHSLDVTITVPIQYDEGEIQAALKEPSLLNLEPHIERITTD